MDSGPKGCRSRLSAAKPLDHVVMKHAIPTIDPESSIIIQSTPPFSPRFTHPGGSPALSLR